MHDLDAKWILSLCVGSVETIIHEHLKFSKVSARWVPKQLTDEHKQQPVSLLSLGIEKNKMNFWVVLLLVMKHGFIIIHQKASSGQCSGSTSPKIFNVQPSAGKVMACIFWDTQGVVLVDFVPPGHTVNVDYYCTLLSDRLRPAVRRNRLGLLKKGVILQHDNAPPHRARQTVQKIEEMGWELLQHRPYSPDLAPSDFHLFEPLKDLLDASSLRTMKMFNNMSYSFYVQAARRNCRFWCFINLSLT